MKTRTRYFRQSLYKSLRGLGFDCPSCGHAESDLVSRKRLVTNLRRCQGCKLLFRAPTTSVEESDRYYQSEYEEGFTTGMPSSRDRLKALKETCFAGTEKDFSVYVEVLDAVDIADGASILDFGSSWGYGSWQLAQCGYEVRAFEVSERRAAYAKVELGIATSSEMTDYRASEFDVVFSAHVLEHVPSLRDAIGHGLRVLKPGGWFISFTPNGSLSFRDRHRKAWQRTWGLKHPNHIDEVYLTSEFESLPYFVGSFPYDLDAIRRWSRSPGRLVGDLMGGELLLIAKKAI